MINSNINKYDIIKIASWKTLSDFPPEISIGFNGRQVIMVYKYDIVGSYLMYQGNTIVKFGMIYNNEITWFSNVR